VLLLLLLLICDGFMVGTTYLWNNTVVILESEEMRGQPHHAVMKEPVPPKKQ